MWERWTAKRYDEDVRLRANAETAVICRLRGAVGADEESRMWVHNCGYGVVRHAPANGTVPAPLLRLLALRTWFCTCVTCACFLCMSGAPIVHPSRDINNKSFKKSCLLAMARELETRERERERGEQVDSLKPSSIKKTTRERERATVDKRLL